MRVLVANPACRRSLGDGRERYMMGAGVRFPWSLLKPEGQRPRFSLFPMFLGYAAALAENAGFEVGALDGVALDLSDDEFLARVSDFAPEIVVMQPNALMIDDVSRLLRQIVDMTGAITILVGEHVTAETVDTFDRCEVLDHAVMGEFEYGLLALLEAIRSDQPVVGLPGVATTVGGTLVPAEGLAPEVEDLDALPRPARHLFPAWFDTDISTYRDGFNQLEPAIDMHATRGCPYNCNFCVWVQVLYDGGRHRRRDVDDVIDEMLEMRDQFGAREIYFDDDNFTAHRGWVKEFCAAMKRREVDLPWSVLADAIALNDGLLEVMADAGCIGVKFGLDSADADVLHATDKPLKVSNVEPLVAAARRLGVKTHMTVVVGLKGETPESLRRTFDFACGLDIDSIQISMATPVPGTRFYDEVQADGSLVLESWEDLDGYSTAVLDYDGLSRDELEEFMTSVQGRWLRARLRHPRWVARQIRYLFRVGSATGVRGMIGRVQRGVQLVRGDGEVLVSSSTEHPADSPTVTEGLQISRRLLRS